MLKFTRRPLCPVIQKLLRERMILSVSIPEGRIFRHSIRKYRLHRLAPIPVAGCRSENLLSLGVRDFSHLTSCVSDHLVLISEHVSGPIRTESIFEKLSLCHQILSLPRAELLRGPCDALRPEGIGRSHFLLILTVYIILISHHAK